MLALVYAQTNWTIIARAGDIFQSGLFRGRQRFRNRKAVIFSLPGVTAEPSGITSRRLNYGFSFMFCVRLSDRRHRNEAFTGITEFVLRKFQMKLTSHNFEVTSSGFWWGWTNKSRYCYKTNVKFHKPWYVFTLTHRNGSYFFIFKDLETSRKQN